MASALRQIEQGMQHQRNGRPDDAAIRRVLSLRDDERIEDYRPEPDDSPPILIAAMVLLLLLASGAATVYAVSALVSWVWP